MTYSSSSVGQGTNAPMALYIHWPFCISKCPYCDFNSHVRESVDIGQWQTALLADMAHEAGETADRKLSSVFFGGGTPSLMPPKLVEALLTAAERHWGFAPDVEITLEANPSSVEAERFADLAAAGVNRASLGLQSLDNEALQFLGRAHTVDEGIAALGTAQKHFKRVSFDLIYALPEQPLDAWRGELERALGFGTSHLSLYQLTIEQGTRFATMAARGDFVPMDADVAAEFYDMTQALTQDAGLPAYEISNHAKTGEESRHNLTYWRYEDYAGIGPGAHGRRNAMATTRHRKPENFLSAVERNGHGLQGEDRLSPLDRSVEALMMGLRLANGVSLDKIDEAIVDHDAVSRLETGGLLIRTDTHLVATGQGRIVLNSLLSEIIRADAIGA